MRDFFEKFPDAEEQREYIEDVVLKTAGSTEILDRKIEEFSKGWKADRISSVSLAVMRLAVYELLYRSDIPPVVAVSEAVSLAKKYEGEEAAPFVNGILDAILKERVK